MTEQPTRVRYEVLAFGCSLSMITYLDRVCFGAAASNIVRELGLVSVSDLGPAITAFAISYAAFEIPSGWWGDLNGPRKVLLRIVVWWSLFTALTGCVGMQVAGLTLGSLSALTAVRFLFGMGEAGAYPNIARAIRNWFPAAERGTAQGWIWMSGRLMGGLTPLIWTVLVAGTEYTPALMNWRGAFFLFGSLGLIWCVLFAKRFRDRPDQHPGVNDAERTWIATGMTDAPEAGHHLVPWRAILLSPNLWLLYLMYFCATYGWFFNISYLPSCLETQFGVAPTSLVGAIYKGGPLWLGAAGCLLGGYVTDRLLRRGMDRRWARRLPGMTGHALCAVCYLAASQADTAFHFFLAISLAAFFNDLMMGSAWATCQDVGGRHTAVVAGTMNMIGGFGASAAGWLSAKILAWSEARHALTLGIDRTGFSPDQKIAALADGYHSNLLIYSAVYVIAVVCWLGINPGRTVEAGRNEHESPPHRD